MMMVLKSGPGSTAPGAGFVVTCDGAGSITQVLIDRMGADAGLREGAHLSELAAPGSEDKLVAFLAEVAKSGVAFDWEVGLIEPAGERAVSLLGTSQGSGLTVVGAVTRGELMKYVGEFFEMNNELVTTVRDLRKQLAAAQRHSADAATVDDLMRLNNDLVTLQRDLAKKNVEIASSRHLIESILDTTPDIIYIFDIGCSCMTYVSRGVTQVLGYEPSDWIGLGDRVIDTLLSSDEAAKFRVAIDELVRSVDGTITEWEGPTRAADGEERWLRRRGTVFQRDAGGRVSRLLVVASDLTHQHEVEQQLREMATIDDLTGLLNRRGLDTLVGPATAQAHRAGSPLGVLVADLDGLKAVNDELGHIEGDRAIVETALVLRRVARQADLVARVGGDEFVIFTMGTGHEGMQRLTERTDEAFLAGISGIADGRLGLSVGFASSDALGDDSFERLFAVADERMYANKRAKGSGR